MSLLPLIHGRHFSYSHREFDVAHGTKTCGATSGSGVRNCSRKGSVAMFHRWREKAFLRASLSRENDVKLGVVLNCERSHNGLFHPWFTWSVQVCRSNRR